MYNVSLLTDRQRQALRAALDTVNLMGGPTLVSPKKALFKLLNDRGFEGSAAAGIITSLRQKADPFELYNSVSFTMLPGAIDAASSIEYDPEKCKVPIKPTKPIKISNLAEIAAGPTQIRERKIKPRPEGYGDCELDSVDAEDREPLYEKPKGYIRGWNQVKRRTKR